MGHCAPKREVKMGISKGKESQKFIEVSNLQKLKSKGNTYIFISDWLKFINLTGLVVENME